MAGFRFKKASAEQAALKMGIYGPPGSGKTLTSLLLAEGLVSGTKKRIAYVDTERGTDFYCQEVKERRVHPQAFDFDAIYTRSITEVLAGLKEIRPEEYGVIVLDSITHLWEACIAAYSGKTGSGGQIPFHAWGKIKKPYKDLMNFLLSSPIHVIICGRQGIEYGAGDDSGELKAIGVKMKAEGETAYEPHILIRMESVRSSKKGEPAIITAFAEKDRTGILAGRSFENPTFQTMCAPLVGLLGDKQAAMESPDVIALQDKETIEREEFFRNQFSKSKEEELVAKIALAQSLVDLEEIGKQITPELKSEMNPDDLAKVRSAYGEKNKAFKAISQ